MVSTPPAPTVETVSVTINGRQFDAPKGMLLVEAAKLVDIDIPVFCYEPRLKPVGACRMCLVQVEKLPRLQTACTTPVAADMIVHTNTPDVVGAQNGVLELLLANHPLDCPICDKGGECPLQDNTFAYGLGRSRFTEEKRHKEKAFPLGDRIVLDRERCIMCYRCVRFHQEIPGDEALAAVSRGVDTEIGTPTGEPYTSAFAGNTIELCPVGALTSRQYRFKARPWDLVRTPSICSGCAVGCNIEVHSRAEDVVRVVSRRNPAVDDGWLCDRGRFETLPASHADRPARPLVRDGERLVPTSWPQALARAVDVLGPRGSVVASSALSNEAFWALQSLSAKVPTAVWPALGTPWPVRGSIEALGRSKTIVLVGLDAWDDLPVLALWIRRAVRNGASLIVLGDRNGLWRDTTPWLKGDPAARLGELLVGLRAGAPASSDDSELAAAVRAIGETPGPASVVAHPSVVAGHDTHLEELASTLGATAESGLVGAPPLGANALGALLLAPDAARADLDSAMSAPGVLLLGDERWADLKIGSFAKLVLATSQSIDTTDTRIEVFLPMAHAYERQGTLTNLEGRVQHQEGGAAPPPHARADWSIVNGLAAQLGVSVLAGANGDSTETIEAIREQIVAVYPNLADIVREEALVARV